MRAFAGHFAVPAVMASLSLAAAACGSPPMVRVPEALLAPLKPTVPTAAGPTSVVKRPDDVVAWIHLDDPDGVADLLSVAYSPVAAAVQPWVDLVSPRQPIDLLLVAHEKNDEDWVVRVSVKDSKAALSKLGEHYSIKESGDHVVAREKSDNPAADDVPDSKPIFECELTQAARGSDVMVCGVGKALESAGEWLRTAPAPMREEGPRTTGQPLARAMVFGPALRRLLDDDRDKEFGGLFDDTDAMTFELDSEGTKLALAGALHLRSKNGKLAKQLLEPTNAVAPNETFFRVWDVANAALFTPGGGPIPNWVKQALDDEGDGNPKVVGTKLSKLFNEPITVAYGVRPERVRAAIAQVRIGKNPAKASHDLADALAGQLIASLGTDVNTVQSTVRDVLPSWNADANRWLSAGEKRTEKFSVRPPTARSALPKGSFILDETKPEWDSTFQSKKTRKEPYLFVPDNATTWVFNGGDEASCAELARKMLTGTKPKAPDMDPLFAKKGLVMAGRFSTQVVAFNLHNIGLGFGAVDPAVLADIEKDLVAPRMSFPFVLSSEARDEGGVVAFEVNGERAEVEVLSKHASAVVLSALGLFMGGMTSSSLPHSPVVVP